jgi:hypothetical protein
MSVVDSSFDHPLRLEEHASMSLAGGIMGNGYQCGMLWGAALAAGAQAYRLLGPGPQAETAALMTTQRLVDSFRTRNKHINCSDITEMNLKSSEKRHLLMQTIKFFLKGGPIACFSMSASYAQTAFNEINAAPFEKHFEAPTAPISCSAMLAQRMGVSSMHAVMAAGFAGGIGLSGGACGALGAAIWIIGMNKGKEGVEKNAYMPTWGEGVIERFLESSDYQFECSEITGRKFESIDEHAGYLRQGGCSKIIETLATSLPF